MNNQEVWKDIPNYEGCYQVSNLGRVKSLKRVISYSNGRRTITERIMKKSIDSNGYPFVNLSKIKKSKPYRVHLLIYKSFFNYVKGLDVDHIDNNPSNCNINNLQQISHRENSSKDKKGYISQYVGVSFDKSRNKWISQIQIEGKTKHLGRFNNEIDAHFAYKNHLKEVIL